MGGVLGQSFGLQSPLQRYIGEFFATVFSAKWRLVRVTGPDCGHVHISH